jgi:DNA topoisomerase-6 subunit B
MRETAEVEVMSQESLLSYSDKQTKQAVSRKAVEEKIHGHIRLQSAEELIKRVDTGFGQKARAPFQAVVEGVQNAADAIDKAREALLQSTGSDDYDAQILVTIDVLDKSRGEIKLTIQDNGIGIPKGKVATIARVGGTGTIEYKASRSQQGIGWKAAAIYANQSTGKPMEIISKTFSERKAHRHVYDYGKGKVTKVVEEPYEGEFPDHGTRMTITLIGNYSRAKANIMEFIKRMAAIHPYITFTLKENGTVVKYEKRAEKGIPIPVPVPPHPNSVDIGQLKDMLAIQAKERSISLAGFLKRNFCRIGDKSIKDLLERAPLLMYFDERGIFAGDIVNRVCQSTKLKELKKDPQKANKYLQHLVKDVQIDYDFVTVLVTKGKLNPNTNIRALSNEELKGFFGLNGNALIPKPIFTKKTTVGMILNDEAKVRLLAETLRSMSFPAPPTDSLMPIPRETLIQGFTTIYKPEKYIYVERNPTSTKGKPVQVQVLGMYGGEIPTDLKDQEKIIRIANCTPLLYEFGSDIITQTAKDVDWSIYKIGKKGQLPQAPVIFVVHVTSPQLKYLGVAKQAVGADDVISQEIKFALQAVSRELRKHVNMLQKSKQSGKARKYLEKHAMVVADSMHKILKVKRAEVYDLLVEEIKRRRPVVEEQLEPMAEAGEVEA